MTVRLPLEEHHKSMTVGKFLKETIEDNQFREILYYSNEVIDTSVMMMYFDITAQEDKLYIKQNFPETLI